MDSFAISVHMVGVQTKRVAFAELIARTGASGTPVELVLAVLNPVKLLLVARWHGRRNPTPCVLA